MERKYMGASGQTLYLKMEQNCIVYERSVKLQDIGIGGVHRCGYPPSGAAGADLSFSGKEKEQLRAGFFCFIYYPENS